MDAFACHFLTDMFSASHTRTPRSSIEAYWDKKVPGFDERLVKWLADEVALAVNRSPSGFLEWLGVTVGAPFGAVRSAARKKVRKVVPPLSFGDVVGLVVHDWEGAHGTEAARPARGGRGPALPHRRRRAPDAGGRRSSAQADDRRPAQGGAEDNKKGAEADRTFAGATLAVRASVGGRRAAFELARKKRKREDIIASLMGKDGLFASERYIPKAVPDAKQPEDDRMPQAGTSHRRPAPQRPQDQRRAAGVGEEGGRAVQGHDQHARRVAGGQGPAQAGDRRAARTPATSGRSASGSRPSSTTRPRTSAGGCSTLPRTEPREDLVDLRSGMH